MLGDYVRLTLPLENAHHQKNWPYRYTAEKNALQVSAVRSRVLKSDVSIRSARLTRQIDILILSSSLLLEIHTFRESGRTLPWVLTFPFALVYPLGYSLTTEVLYTFYLSLQRAMQCRFSQPAFPQDFCLVVKAETIVV